MKTVSSLLVAIALAQPAAAGPFWPHWSDGRAELDGYELIQPRYGEKRAGRAVLVYVTEPYSKSRHVKVDRYDSSDPDQITVLKLNIVRKFQTGVYDYSAMTSVFADPGRGFRPLEVSFSLQEWCGHVYEETLFGNSTTVSVDSYFEGESGSWDLPAGVVPEDQLLISLRSLDSEELIRKERELKLLASPLVRRLAHLDAEVTPSRLTWSDAEATVEVPAGTFDVYEASYRRPNDVTCTYRIEAAYPHRIVAWSCSDGEEARLTGSARLDYWNTKREGDEELLKELGLSPSGYRP